MWHNVPPGRRTPLAHHVRRYPEIAAMAWTKKLVDHGRAIEDRPHGIVYVISYAEHWTIGLGLWIGKSTP